MIDSMEYQLRYPSSMHDTEIPIIVTVCQQRAHNTCAMIVLATCSTNPHVVQKTRWQKLFLAAMGTKPKLQSWHIGHLWVYGQNS